MKTVKPSEINGTVRAPPSKSMMQRAVAVATMADGPVKLINPTFCSDSLAAMEIAKALGASVKKTKKYAEIIPSGKIKSNRLDCAESGLCIRLFPPIVALNEGEFIFEGKGGLLKRPVSMVEDALAQFGVRVKTNGGFPPMRINGPIRGANASIDASLSSQHLSGLLLALPKAGGNSAIKVHGLKSKPYAQMTVQLAKEFGVEIFNAPNFDRFEICGGQNYRAKEYEIEGDWSGAAFLLVAGAIGGKIKVEGLNLSSLQADRAILDALKKAGSKVMLGDDFAMAEKGELRSFEFDVSDCPDLAPPLVALASCCKGRTVLRGTARLKIKESDRASALASEFSKLGVCIKVSDERMEIYGGEINSAIVDSHGDHRIAMACAVAALRSKRAVKIKGEECVAKSFPEFFQRLEEIKA